MLRIASMSKAFTVLAILKLLSRGPGLAIEYSNYGYATLGRIISNVSGTSYENYIRREIMIPLGMTSSGFDIFASLRARRAVGYRWQAKQWVREPGMEGRSFGAMGGIETVQAAKSAMRRTRALAT